jgi:ABC-type multidrug transport system ATPase subunit
MDPVSRRGLWKIIKDLKNDMKTVVITTQFLDEAEELADRIAIMSKGLY